MIDRFHHLFINPADYEGSVAPYLVEIDRELAASPT